MKVFLGVGHGGSDSGATGNGFTEKALNLSIALHCKAELEANGVTVGMSRQTDENDPINDEVKECNAYAPDLAVDIHNNAGGGDGAEVFYSHTGLGKNLAQNILNEIIAIGQNSRGIKTKTNSAGNDYFAFNRSTNCTAVIVECAFVDNATDIKIIDTEEERQAMGKAIAKGILKTLGVSANASTSNNEVKTMKYFQLLQEMNMRATPNGTLITAIPAGKIIQGTELKSAGVTQWLYTSYNGKNGYVCVLPESRKYAKEVSAPQSTPSFCYAIDSKGANGVSGWLYDGTDKEYEIHAYINGTGFNSIYANVFREDLKNAGIGNGKHGFNWEVNLYEIFGAGTFDIKLYAITEIGTNPYFYSDKITIEKPSEVEKPVETESDKTQTLEKENAALKAKIEQIKKIIDG